MTLRKKRGFGTSNRLQHFENKYFELIKMHRDNVAEMTLHAESGRKIFVLLIRELRCALDIVRALAPRCNYELSQREQLHAAYYCLFYGVGENSSRMLKKALVGFRPDFVNAVEQELNNGLTKDAVRKKRGFQYTPFEGHQSRLGHYYRHLYQMIRFVHEQKIDVNKYEYVRTIRAQLSTHEQALLLVNSLTPIGQDWWKNKYIQTYRMVQNIPREFFDCSTELDMTTQFEPGYFEWEEAHPEK